MFLIGQFFAIMTFQDDRGILDYGKLRSYLLTIPSTFSGTLTVFFSTTS